MNSFDAARLAARALRAVATSQVPGAGLLALAEAAAGRLGFEVSWVEPGSTLLNGATGVFDPQGGVLTCARRGNEGERALLLAHEIAHEAVHRLATGFDALIAAGGEPAPATRMSDYGPRERRELEAEVFAREFVLPRSEARGLHLEGRMTAESIVQVTGLPRGVVERQLLDSLLLPDVVPEPPVAAGRSGLDASQEAAANHGDGPLLLSAAPGTGKTRTLVARVSRLVDGGAEPASILVLTFSNRAAAEVAARICAALPDAGPRVWVGTFHQFGMDLIRRHSDRLGVPERPLLIDRSAAVELLEEQLAALDLSYHRNLWSPEMLLKDVLAGISRAKDELVGAKEYAALADAMRERAEGDPSGTEAAERAQEVARVYSAYEAALSHLGAVDFGDQIMLPALMLEKDPHLGAELRLRHRHVLVDEYQDVNRASIRLLRAVIGTGGNIWAVGDARQAIYRFRGAASASMSRFETDFGPCLSLDLDINYRSSGEIVDGYVGFSRSMAASAELPPLALAAERGMSGLPATLTGCMDDDSETASVVAAVKGLAGQGVGLSQQAVLCRVHAQAERITAALEAAGIPVLRLGNVLERHEIRDLLSILSLAADTTGSGLPRIGTMPRYRMTLQDVRVAASVLRHGKRTTMESLRALGQLPGMSPGGASGLSRLADDLNGFTPFTSAWDFMSTFLLDRTRWIADLATEEGVQARMRCLAVWNLMEVLRTPQPSAAGPPITRLLQRVRRIALLGEARSLGEVPEAARGLDAVQVMTVHASKGLEFEAVHLPGLHHRGFPQPYRAVACPPPEGMTAIPASDPAREAETEEECLFFVAMSRARTHLRLYCSSSTVGKKPLPRKRSAFLAQILPAPLPVTGETPVMAAGLTPAAITVNWPPGGIVLEDHQIEQLRRCPRRMLLTVLLGLRSARHTGPFARTHDCVQRLIDFLVGGTGIPGEDGPVDLEEAFETIWLEHGPRDHGYAVHYRSIASGLIAEIDRLLDGRARFSRASRFVSIDGLKIGVRADHSQAARTGSFMTRIRTGSDSSEDQNVTDALLYLAAQDPAWGPGRAEIASLTDRSLRTVEFKRTKLANRMRTLEELVGQLRSGFFPDRPDSGSCPRCPHWFACGRLPDGTLTFAADAGP